MAPAQSAPVELEARTGVTPSALGATREKRATADNTAPAKASALPDPAAELERIARLRAEGRHEEADKALEAFNRAHPDYRIPDAVWLRVRPR